MSKEMEKRKNRHWLSKRKLIIADIIVPIVTVVVLWLLGHYIPTIPELSSFLKLYFIPWMILAIVLLILGYRKPSVMISAMGGITFVVIVYSAIEMGKIGIDNTTEIDFKTPKENIEGVMSRVDPSCEIYLTVKDVDGIKGVDLYLDEEKVDISRIRVKKYSKTMWEVSYAPELEFVPLRHRLEVVVTDYHFLSKWKNPHEEEIQFQVVACESFTKPLGNNYCWTPIRGEFEITNGKLIIKHGNYRQARIGYLRFRDFFFTKWITLEMVVYPIFSEEKGEINFIVFFGKNYKLTIGDGNAKTVTLRKFEGDQLVDSESFARGFRNFQGHHIVCKSFLDEKEHAQKFFVSLGNYDSVTLSDPDPVSFEGYIGLGVWKGTDAVKIEQLKIWAEQPFVK